MTNGVAGRLRVMNPLLVLGGLVMALYLAFIGLPIVSLIVEAVGEENFLDSFTSTIAYQSLRLSLITTAISLAIIVVLGTPFAYLLARSRHWTLRVVDSLVELPIVLPPVVAGLAMLMAFGRRGLLGPGLEDIGVTISFSTVAVLFAQIFVSAPFYIRAAKIGFEGVERDYEDVSQTLGVSPWRTFWRLTLPMAWPVLAGGAVLAWARALSEFGATIMFAGNFIGETQTMPLAILSAMESNIPAALALAVMLTVISAVFLLGLRLVYRAPMWGRR
ncbi:MAG: molybdate ABC transporter permease subunit [SAR202 cluster bacterium]|nr:molybdate ABC transporter permease subunit [SAR202 cluster bacterium]